MITEDVSIPAGDAEMGEPRVGDRRPKMGMNAKTQRYWMQKLTDAKRRLSIPDRQIRARDYRKFITHELDKNDPTNPVSKKLEAQVVNTVSDIPVITPQYKDLDTEEKWMDISTALVMRDLKKADIIQTLHDCRRDNQVAGISWLKIDFSDIRSKRNMSARLGQRQAQSELEVVLSEHELWLMGGAPTVDADDVHPFHVEGHERFRAEAQVRVEMGELDPGMLGMIDSHIAEHRAGMTDVYGEMVNIRRWPAFMVYYDPDALTWADVEWYAVVMIERKETLLDDETLSNVRPLKGAAYLRADPLDERNGLVLTHEAPDERHIQYYMIHDRIGKNMIMVAHQETNEQKPMFVGPWPYPGTIVHPLVINTVPDQIHGVADMDKVQRDYAHFRDGMKRAMHHISKVPVAKTLVSKNLANNKEFMSKLMDPYQAWVDCDNPEQVNVLQTPQLSEELYRWLDRQDLRMNESLGTPDFVMTESPRKDETATATAARQSQFSTRIASDKQRIAHALEWVCQQVHEIWRRFGTLEQYVRWVGDRGRIFEAIDPQELPADVCWSVDPDGLTPTHRDLAKKQTIELLQVLQPHMESGVINTPEILKRVVRRFEIVEDVNDIISPGPPYSYMQQAMRTSQQKMAPNMPSMGIPQQVPSGIQQPMLTGQEVGNMNGEAVQL